jgi:hypothetical protein
MRVSNDDYGELKAFLAFYATKYLHVDRLPPSSRPIACLEALEQKSLGKAKAGLRQAINDIIEMTRHLSNSEVQRIDSELRQRNLITLTALRRRFSKAYAKILKRGTLRDETEYYLIQNVVNDQAIQLDLSERAALARMIDHFETRAVDAFRSTRRSIP